LTFVGFSRLAKELFLLKNLSLAKKVLPMKNPTQNVTIQPNSSPMIVFGLNLRLTNWAYRINRLLIEGAGMNKQDKQEPNNQQSVVEDLTVDEGQAEEIKGGTTRQKELLTLTFENMG
jgi:hypothetical protein